MTAPPITARADGTVVRAARTRARRRVDRLPVLDAGGRPVGVVTRHDLMRILLRPDAETHREVIEEILVKAPRPPPGSVGVLVTEGVIVPDGRRERGSETETAVAVARRTDGVVAVVDGLAHRMERHPARSPGPARRGRRTAATHPRDASERRS